LTLNRLQPVKRVIRWRDHQLTIGPRTLVMGVLNVTPDSFSDGGEFYATDAAIERAQQMVAEGADIIDVGGESTRPFADPVPCAQEMARVIPVIEAIATKVKVPISIDTTKAEVARLALDAGAAMINDISALHADPQIAVLAAQLKVPLIVMHMQGTPRTMQTAPAYDHLVDDIKAFLADALARAISAGVAREMVMVDPGIGFGKTFQQNFALIRHLGSFMELGAPLLVGPSRKAFIRHAVKNAGQKDIDPQAPEVVWGTQAAVAAAAINGAHIVRVHDVAEAVASLKVADAIRRAPGADGLPKGNPMSA
jgi:dihydropteroate synthase